MTAITRVERQFTIEGFYTAFSFSWDDTFAFAGESHIYWEIVFLTGGSVISTEDDRIYILEENNILLHAPMEFHRIRSAEGSNPSGIIMTFLVTGTLPEELKNGVFTLQPEDRTEYEAIVKKIIAFKSKSNTSPAAGQQAADLLSTFLIKLACKTADKNLAASAGATEYHKVVADMTARVCENLSLLDFANAHNISVSYIKLLFKKYAGISPKAYYSHLRARHAAKLLEDGLTVSEIADRMNFSSSSYFTVFFRNHMDCNPSEYKKKQPFPQHSELYQSLPDQDTEFIKASAQTHGTCSDLPDCCCPV